MSPTTTRTRGLLRGLLAATAGAALAAVVSGCSWFDLQDDPYHLAPSLEMGERLSEDSTTEPFAMTNEGRKIEDRLLSRDRQTPLLP